MNKALPTRCAKPGEEGYILIAVIFMLALLIIAMAVAAPRIRTELQRDREIETMHRGKQYARAIKLYYKKFGAYPANVDALVNTNQIRFLRRKYVDPTTGKEEWKVIHVGQQKASTLGFFGQPIGGTGGATGSLTGNALPGSTGPGSTGIGSTGIGSTGFGSTGFGAQTPQSGIGAISSSTDASSNAQTATPGATGSSTGTTSGTVGTTGTDANGNPSTTGSAFGTAGGQTFGGAGIVGFSPNSPKDSLLVYKKKKHYNEWEFTYDPLADQMMMQGGNTGTVGQPAGSSGIGSGPGIGNGTGSSGGLGFGVGSGSGNSSSGSGFGTSGSGTGNPTPTPPTQTPQ